MNNNSIALVLILGLFYFVNTRYFSFFFAKTTLRCLFLALAVTVILLSGFIHESFFFHFGVPLVIILSVTIGGIVSLISTTFLVAAEFSFFIGLGMLIPLLLILLSGLLGLLLFYFHGKVQKRINKVILSFILGLAVQLISLGINTNIHDIPLRAFFDTVEVLYFVFYSLLGAYVFFWSFGWLNSFNQNTNISKEDRYKFLIEKLSGAVLKTDHFGRITYANNYLLNKLGRSIKEIKGRYATDIIFRNCSEAKKVLDYVNNLPGNSLESKFDCELTDKAGDILWFSWDCRIAEDESDELFEILFTGVEVTDLKRNEQALQSVECQLKLLYDGLIDSYIKVDKHGTLLEFNNAFLGLTGYSADDLLGLSVEDITPASYHKFDKTVIDEQIIPNGFSNLYEKEFTTKDEKSVAVELRAYRMLDSNGNYNGYWAIIRDISERKEHERQLRALSSEFEESALLFKNLLNAIPDVIGVQNVDKTVLLYNEAGYRMLGFKPNEVFGKKCYELIGRVKPCDLCASQKVLETKHPELVEKFIPEMNVWLESRAYPVFDNNGDIKYIIEHLRDITTRKQDDIALKQNEMILRNMVENSPLPKIFFEINQKKECVVSFINPAAEKFFGDFNNSNGKHISEIFGENILEKVSNTINKGVGFKDECFRLSINGSTFFIELQAYQTIPGKAVLQLNDITQKIRDKEQLELSEQKFRMIITENPMVFFVLDSNGIFTLSEGAGLAQLGLNPGQVVGLSVFDVYKDFPEIIESSKKSLNGESVKLDLKVGDVFYNTVFTPVFDENNRVKNVLGIAYDITSRINAEHEVERKSEELERYFNNSLDLLCIADLQGNFRKVNPEWSRLLGYGVEELSGRKFFDFIHPDDTESTYKAVKELSGRGKVLNFTNRYRTKQGEYRWLEWRSFFDNDLIYAVARDVTERKTTEEQLVENERILKEQNEEYVALNEELSESNQRIREINEKLIEATEKAQESDRLKSAFLANMSHEIRTPMNGIVGFCQLLKQTNAVDEQVTKYCDIIATSSNQLLAIINDIIDISKIEAGQVTLSHEPVSIMDVVERTMSIFSALANQRNVELKINSEIDSSLVILSDQTKIAQILSNLVNNAIKFTQQGFVEVGVSENSKHLKIWVKDTGIGIAKENQALIFDRFRQVDGANPNSMKGTGLGLSISKSLVEMLGGEIWVDSDLGKGATFTFTIPNIKAMDGFETVKRDDDTPDKFDFGGVSILLAEDDNINKLLLRRALESANAKVLLASNGAEAIEVLKGNSNIRIVLMDIKMPVMDGLEATQLIKLAHPNMPIVAQTAYALPDERKRAIEAGCDAYLTKPINITVLYKTIQQLM